MRKKKLLQVCALTILAASSAWSAEKVIAVGDVPYDFLGRDGDKAEVRLGQHRGKVAIVSFFATWCGPCRKEVPVLANIQKIAGRDKLVVVAVDFKEDASVVKKVRKLFKDYDLTFTHDASGKISDEYGVDVLPNMFIVGADGKVAAVHKGYSEAALPHLVAEINRIWRETNTQPTPSAP